MPTDPARQVRQRLAALKAAGVDFVPRSHAPALPPPAEPSPSPEPDSAPPPPPPPAAGRAESPAPPRPAVPPPVVDAAGLFAAPTEAVPDTLDGRRHELQLLADRVAPCDRCPELFATRTQTVFGVGPVGADICFIGEAPGADEDASGEPFVGRSGQLLDRIIAACGMTRDDVYVCNIIKCRPPGSPPTNRTPTPQECSNCREYLERQIELVGPKYIVALGGVAAQNLLGSKATISKLRGTVHKYCGIPVVCTFHPAALLRNEAWKKDCWDDMKMLLREMGRPIPGARG